MILILNDFLLEYNLHLSILKINFKQSHLWFNFEFVNFKLTFWIESSISIDRRNHLIWKHLNWKRINWTNWNESIDCIQCDVQILNSQFSILNWILPLQFFQFNSWFLILQRECDVMLMLLLIKKIFFLFSLISLFFQFLYFFTWIDFVLLNCLNW